MNDKKNISDNSDFDSLLRQRLKASALQAPPSPWFTRKVMNRLPEKHMRLASRIEYVVYAIAALATVVMGIIYCHNTLSSGVITVGNIIMLATYIGIFLAIIALAVTPWFFRDDTVQNPKYSKQ